MTMKKMTLDAGLSQKNRAGSQGGAAPQWVWVSGSRPPPGSGSARTTRNYPSQVQEGIWVWVKYSKLKAKKICPFPPALPKHKKHD